jgi:HEXXH motif-containing protein
VLHGIFVFTALWKFWTFVARERIADDKALARVSAIERQLAEAHKTLASYGRPTAAGRSLLNALWRLGPFPGEKPVWQ